MIPASVCIVYTSLKRHILPSLLLISHSHKHFVPSHQVEIFLPRIHRLGLSTCPSYGALCGADDTLRDGKTLFDNMNEKFLSVPLITKIFSFL
jgi:hypothetical protein